MIQTEIPDGQGVVLAHTDRVYAVRAKHALARLGWKVLLARSAAGVRRLARLHRPSVVVLDINLGDETGWLLCRKLKCEHPGLSVILVSNQSSPEQARLAKFVGAAKLLRRQEGVAGLAKELSGSALVAGC